MITIRVNGNEYSGFIEAAASKDIEDLCGQFSFTATGYDFPIKIQDKCEIYVNGKKFLTGFVEKRHVSVNASTRTISIAGRDKLSLLVDNTVSQVYQYVGGQTLASFCRQIISDLGLDIDVIAKKNPIIPEEDFPSCEIDTTAFEVIDDVCKRLQVLATSDENGNLVLMSAGNDVFPTALVNEPGGDENNVLSASYDEDYTNRFYKYNVYSQDNFAELGFTPLPNTPVPPGEPAPSPEYDVLASAIDSAVSKKRKINLVMKNSYSEDQADNYAKYTSNIRRVESTQYEATVVLHQGTEGGRIWEHNKLYSINDGYCGINTQMLCKGITYSFSNEGETTTLLFVAKDAFKVQASKPFEDRSYFGDLGLGGLDL